MAASYLIFGPAEFGVNWTFTVTAGETTHVNLSGQLPLILHWLFDADSELPGLRRAIGGVSARSSLSKLLDVRR